MALTLKQYCEQNKLDPDSVFNMVVGEGGGILPTVTAFTGYITEIREDRLVCTNDRLGVYQKEIPFSSFERAEFGIGSGNLWLQCRIDGAPFVFCSPRKSWKSPAARLLLERIGEKTEILSKKEYDQFTGKLFFIYLFK